jgi:hypothetical protein
MTLVRDRRAVWVLGKRIGTDEEGKPMYEYFTGEQGDRGGPSRSPFRSDGYKFHSARSAIECAGTHGEMQDSEDWRVLTVIDNHVVEERPV